MSSLRFEAEILVYLNMGRETKSSVEEHQTINRPRLSFITCYEEAVSPPAWPTENSTLSKPKDRDL